jgi:transcriptional regulator with XRE-family HTH domain
MSIDAKSSDVAARLRQLQATHKLTIQEMADRCGMPKRSLENYMRLKEPQRPGVDALIGIADGMGVSIDWIVGRSDGREVGEEERRRIALSMFRLMLEVLRDIEKVQAGQTEPLVKDGKVGPQSIEDFAVRMMLHFVVAEKLFADPHFDTFRILDEVLEQTDD